MADLHVPIEPLEIPRPPVPQPPERLFLFVCDHEDPTPAGKLWASARTQGAGSLQGQSLQEMYGGDSVSQAQLAALDGALYGYASQGRRETLGPPKPPTFRRATPDDLLAFGFVPAPLGLPGDVADGDAAQALTRLMDRLPVALRMATLALLQERYGDGT